MDLNPAEWNQAQNLLLKLVQVLSPLTVRPVASSEFLSRRFFVPPAVLRNSDFFQRHPARLLIMLHEVQKEVDNWISESGNLIDSEKSEAPPKTPFPEELKNLNSGFNQQQESRPQRNEGSLIKNHAKSFPKQRETLPLVKQASELVHQVQDAIRSLANSTYMQEPSEAPLRELLRKLKPNLDRIIDLVVISQEKPDLSTLFSRPLPIPVREGLLEKLHKLKNKKVALSDQNLTRPNLESAFSTNSQKRFLEHSASMPSKSTLEKKQSYSEDVPVKEEEKAQAIQKKTNEKISQKRAVLEKEENLHPKKDADASKARLEKEEQAIGIRHEIKPVALPIPPAFFMKKPSIRKKKPRKGFWFKEEEKDPSDR